jgi:predicted RecB family nuclease
VLQLCFYTEQLARIQGRWPEAMHVVNGLGERESFRPDDFFAYYRRLRTRFLEAVEKGGSTYPYPVDHCSLCEFLVACKEQWKRDDHLSLVAGIRRSQVDRLVAAGITELEALATTSETKVPKLRAEMLSKLREQAGLQLHRRQTGELEHVVLPLEPERGFALLPEPSPGDIWLDLEGDPWYEPQRGLEYLLGWVYLDDHGEPQYDCIWGLDRAEEKAGFERLLDLICELRARFPRMHVYHYASYERTALQQLMGAHGTREAELDDLLRGEVLVDLFRVVRQALRLSVESYSIKQVEAFYGFERGEEMRGGGGAVVAFEEWLEAREDAILEEIRAYNEDDCRSLYELHRWLLELRPGEVGWRPPPEAREVKEETRERLEELALVEAELLAGAEEGEPKTWGSLDFPHEHSFLVQERSEAQRQKADCGGCREAAGRSEGRHCWDVVCKRLGQVRGQATLRLAHSFRQTLLADHGPPSVWERAWRFPFAKRKRAAMKAPTKG